MIFVEAKLDPAPAGDRLGRGNPAVNGPDAETPRSTGRNVDWVKFLVLRTDQGARHVLIFTTGLFRSCCTGATRDLRLLPGAGTVRTRRTVHWSGDHEYHGNRMVGTSARFRMAACRASTTGRNLGR